MYPLTFKEVSANEEAAGRYLTLPRRLNNCPARHAYLSAERHARFPCPICGNRTRIATVFAAPGGEDAQAYARCYNCGHLQGL